MKKNNFIIFIFIILLINNSQIFSQSGWVVQNSGTTEDLWSIDFTDEYTGYISCSMGLILKTTNEGNNWSIQHAGNSNLIGVDFINDQTGWVSGHSGTIYKTTNGGINWISQISTTNDNLFFVNFINENTGFISSDAGLLKTTNGGDNWSFSYMSGYPVYSFYFLNENYGWFGNNIGNQYLSTNGGTYWLYTQNIINNGNIAYYFADENTGWASGYNNQIIHTSNGGYSWEMQYSDPGYGKQLRDIDFINNTSETGWAVGFYNDILKTTNGGNNWLLQSSPVNANFTSVKFVNTLKGWIIGQGGVILRTKNEGVTNINNIVNSQTKKYELLQNYPNPFNPSTNINFNLPNSGFTTLKVYDVRGREVADLINEHVTKGKYEINFDASKLSSGIYFYKLISGDFISTKKMTLIK